MTDQFPDYGAPVAPTLLRRIWLWQHGLRYPNHVPAGRHGITLTCATCIGAVRANSTSDCYFGPAALHRLMTLRRFTKPVVRFGGEGE